METKGQIGTIFDGNKQIGGFTGWCIEVRIEGKAKTYISASGFWMLEKPPDKVMAKFYQILDNDLVLANERLVSLSLPDEYPLDTLVRTSIEMIDG